jgi:16S rRNA (guanine966-N2)-methyltransferase
MGLRVTGGSLGGRRLRAPGAGVRPTADRVRESLFARLGDLEGVAVLDLFAGTGALGIEALSRGAMSLVAVERSRTTRRVLEENLAALGLASVARVEGGAALACVQRLGRARTQFDLVFLDPPYAADAAVPVLAAIVNAGILAPHGVVVLERSRSHPVAAVSGLPLLDERRYGDTVISQFQASSGGAEERRSEAGGRIPT